MRAWLQRHRLNWGHLFRLLGALALALLVWLYVTVSRNPEMQFRFEGVPVEVRALRPGLVLTDSQGIPQTSLGTNVSLVIWAPEAERLTADDLEVSVNLAAVQGSGTYHLPIEVQVNGVARTWTVNPQEVTVRVEELQEDVLPIKVELLGQPGFPYIVGTPVVSPTHAMVQGPLSRVQLVRRVRARADLAGRTSSLENAPVAVTAVDNAGNEVKGVTVIPPRATLSVPVALIGGHLAVPVVPMTTGHPAPGYFVRAVEVSPTIVTVFSGEPAVLASLRYLETAMVDLTDHNRDFTATVDLRLPPNVALIHSPSQVIVTVLLGQIESHLFLEIPVRLANLGDGLKATWEPTWMDVVVEGPLEVLQGLSLSEIGAVVDVGELEAGDYDLGMTFEAPPEVVVSPTHPITIHVIITRLPTPTVTPTATYPPRQTLPPRPTPIGTVSVPPIYPLLSRLPPAAPPPPPPTPAPTPPQVRVFAPGNAHFCSLPACPLDGGQSAVTFARQRGRGPAR